VRRLAPSPPLLVVASLLIGTMAVSAASMVPTAAGRASDPTPIAQRGSRTVDSAVPSAMASNVAAPSLVPLPIGSLQPTPAADPPRVVRFRPRDGWTGVSRYAAVSVRFTRPMDHASTERAFRVVMGERRVPGSTRWAEGDTVLVLTPASALPYGASISLSIGVGARARDGVAIAAGRSVTFRVQERPRVLTQGEPSQGKGGTATRRSSGWRWPLLGPITQRFGQSLTKYGFHQGIDIDGQTGDRVRAARGGRVVVAGRYDGCGGLEVHIDHGGGISSWYRHLSRIDVTTGVAVAAGTAIGRVGDTGCSLGSHLHFGIRKGSTFVDPLRYLPPR
jgi:murein DD-endopeptidase MepM/ murein hydrolase activator NlpD